MVTINNVRMFILQGNTYPNLPAIRATGAQWNQKERAWILTITGHPLNNTKQRKKLEAMLTELEAAGVRFVAFKEFSNAG